MKTLRHLIFTYPLQSFLLLYNMGVFTWLQTNSGTIAEQLGVRSDWIDLIPTPIRLLTGDSLTSVQGLIGQSGWTWLICSMLILLVIRWIKGLLKFLLVCLLIVLGVYLIMQNQQILSNLAQGF